MGAPAQVPGGAGDSSPGAWLCLILLALFAPNPSLGQVAFFPNPGAPAAPPPSLITNLAQLRALDRDTARLRLPVRLRGVVTYFENQWPSLFVQDGTNAAAYVHRAPGLNLAPGDLIEIEGHCGEGFTPQIYADQIRHVGRADLPPPIPATLEEMATGRFDGLRVRVVTTVRWMHRTWGRLYLYVGEGSGRFEVHIPDYTGPLPRHLLDARVEFTGVTGTKMDSHGKLTGAGMSLPRIEDVRVMEPASADLWQQPAQAIATLMYFHPRISFGQKTRVRGVVTLISPSGQLYVEDETGGVAVRLPAFQQRPDAAGQYLDPASPPDLELGDRVEVAAYPAVGAYAPILTDALVRRTSHGGLPQPHPVSATNVLNSPLNSRRILLAGTVMAAETRPSKTGTLQRLTVQADNVLFFAEHEGEHPLAASPGSRVELTGICSFEVDEQRHPVSFRILLADPGDVRVLAGPPLVTTRRLLQVGVPLGIGILGWVWLLRRQVRSRTADLLESEERFHKAFQASPALMALTRLEDGTFVAANEAFCRMSGYTQNEVIGRPALELNLYAVPRHRESYVQRIRRDGRVRDLEVPLRAKDGSIRTVLLSGERIELEGQPHLLSVGLDITGRKQAESDTLKALAREKELSELKSNFVSMVSHEFRTPLGVIQSASDVLDRYLDRLPPEKRRKHLDMIFRSTRNLAQLVEGVLLLGKVEDGRMQFTPEPLDLGNFFAQLIDEVHSATARQCPIELAAGEGLGSASSDPALLRHIFANLLSNAVKYSPPGTPVLLEATRDGVEVVCRVRDRGIGIPEEDQRNLFKSFARGGNVGGRPGTGLGLVIVQRCVELHRGRIDIQSVPGQGTTVTVRLPVFAGCPLSEPTASATGRVTSAANS